MSQHRLELPLGATSSASRASSATSRRDRPQAPARPVSVYDATGGAEPVHVARRPVTVASWSAAVAVGAGVVAVVTRGDHWTPIVLGLLAAAAAVVAVWGWMWSRRPQVVIGHRGIWFAATEDRPEVVHPWADVLAVYGETREEHAHPAQVHGVERHLLGVHLRSQTDPEYRVVRRGAISPLIRLHRVVVSVAPTVPVTRQEPWGPRPGQHPLVVLWRRLVHTS